MEATKSATNDTRPEKGAKKLATQQRIIDAFERILLNEGIDGLGINAIVKEAKIGKGLIYEYFGGLDGLAQAWMQRADMAPSLEDIAGEDLDSFTQRKVRERQARIYINFASMLRDHPAACRILAEDLRYGAQLPEAFQAVKKKLGKSHEDLVMGDPEQHEPDRMAMSFILHAAANYLALRANSSPNFNGIQLDTEEGWEQVMDMLRAVAEGR